jgi:hypothetical protein
MMAMTTSNSIRVKPPHAIFTGMNDHEFDLQKQKTRQEDRMVFAKRAANTGEVRDDCPWWA